MNETLFEVVTVHCFFGRWCDHVVRNIDPYQASREMEMHYKAKHYGKHMDIVMQEVGTA